jgi:N-acetyl-anhydromuramyl-L-alanine amidase AmpD
LGIVRDGRADVPGPLSQLGLGRSGKVYVIAAGRANHAGRGSFPGLLGNRDTVGIEAEHPGGSTPWDPAMYDAYVRLVAALKDRLEVPTSLVIGHKEWAPTRKVDPTFDMDRFREHVGEIAVEPELVAFVRWLKEQYEAADNPAFDTSVEKAIARGVYTQHTNDEDAVTAAKLAVFLDRAGVLDKRQTGVVDEVARSGLQRLLTKLRAV